MGDARAVLVALIKENFLVPGSKKLFVSYYRKRVYADLLPDGSIQFKDTIYQSPVPCALQMKRSLNPSLKTDAGWSSMFSAASGESLKDIKDRLNIRKRGPNIRTTMKKAPSASSIASASLAAKERLVNAAVEITRLAPVAPKCPKCRKDASGDVAACSACFGKTHLQCAQPALNAVPSTPWFCDSCLTSQADGILEFLQQTRRILVERIHAAKTRRSDTGDGDSTAVATADENAVDSATVASPATTGTAAEQDDTEQLDTSASGENEAAPLADAPVAEATGDAAESATPRDEDAAPSDSIVVGTPSDSVVVGTTPEEKFLALIDALMDDVSSKEERMHLIANSTGATLVHLAKTLLVQLVETGNREIAEATTEDDASTDNNNDAVADADTADPALSRTSEVDALVKIFDLRHQILSSQAQFERTTGTLSMRTEKRLRAAEAELMALEEARATEARAVSTIVERIAKYDQDLAACRHKIALDNVVLESLTHRRNWIRATNISARFVPAYRLTTKQMSSSSDQLLYTVLLDKLQSMARAINEWATMEAHFEKMTASLDVSLAALGTTKGEASAGRVQTPALFARVKIPPSRRLMERQLANYAMNVAAIRARRAEMRKTLAGVLKIAREEHLSSEIIDLTDLLHRKCRAIKGEDDDDDELDVDDVEEIDDETGHGDDASAAVAGVTEADHDRKPVGDASDEPERKKQRVEPSSTSSSSELQTEQTSDSSSQPTQQVVVDQDAREDASTDRAPEVPPSSNVIDMTESGNSSAKSDGSAEEIPLSEASATLADLTPDESLDTVVSKYPSHTLILNLDDEIEPKGDNGSSDTVAATEATSTAAATSASYAHESAPNAAAPDQSKFSLYGDDRKRPSHAGHFLDGQASAPQQQPVHADSLFHTEFQSNTSSSGSNTSNTVMIQAPSSYTMQQDAANASAPSSKAPAFSAQDFAVQPSLLFPSQPAAAAPRKPTKAQKERQSTAQLKKDAGLLQQQQQRAEHERQQRQHQQLQELQRAEHERQQQLQRAEQERHHQQLQRQQEQERQQQQLLRAEQERQQQLQRAEQERQQQLQRAEQERQQQLQRAEQERQQQQQRQRQQEQEQRQREEEQQQAFLNQALEVLKQQQHMQQQQQQQRKPVVAVPPPPPSKPLAPPKPLAQPKPPKQPKQPKLSLPPAPPMQQQQQQQQHMQSQLHQQFQRVVQQQQQVPPSSLGLGRGKDLSLHHSPSQAPTAQSTPQLSSNQQQQLQQQQQVHHAGASSPHLQMLSHAHQQLSQQQQHQVPLHLQQQQQQQQQQSLQQRPLQHPLYGDVPKGLSMSGLSNAQDLYVDHTQQQQQQQQAHMGMDLQQHLHATSHLSAADVVMRPHDLTGASHFGTASANAATLRSSAFLSASDATRTSQAPSQQQQRAYYGDDAQSHLHAHDIFSSQLGGHQTHQQQTQHHNLFGSDLTQQQQHHHHQQQQHSRSILTDQDYQSHLLTRHYRDQDMDPSGGSDDVNMGQWN